MRRAALLAVGIALASCNPFGTDFPDVCAQYQGRTCIALGLGCEGDHAVDQFELQSPVPGVLPGGPLRVPATPGKVHLPAVIAILPDATFAGGVFTIDIIAYVDGAQVIGGEQQGSVGKGGSTRVGADSDNQLCLNQLPPRCNGCPTCCVEGRCIQPFQACDSTSVCASETPGGALQCLACGGLGQTCCQGATCNVGCCNSGNNGGTCVALDSLCSNGSIALYCLAPNGMTPTCRPCGDPGQACCVGASCNTGGCCDPMNGKCAGSGALCQQTNTFCKAKSCTPCGGSGESCCPGPSPCTTGTCNGTTMMCP